MSTAQIQMYDGFLVSPVLGLDECGECALQVIDETFKEVVGSSDKLLLSHIFGILVRKAIAHLDNRGALTSALTIDQRGSFLRDSGLNTKNHFGSFVVELCATRPRQPDWITWEGKMHLKSVSREQKKIGFPKIHPLGKLNEELNKDCRSVQKNT